MKAIKQDRVENILRKGNITGSVETPKGMMLIYTLEESRGYQTNYFLKKFNYVKLPDGRFFTLTKAIENHWKNSGFKINNH